MRGILGAVATPNPDAGKAASDVGGKPGRKAKRGAGRKTSAPSK